MSIRRDFSRTARLNEVIHRELALLLQQNTKDPRIGLVTISEVEVTKDLSYATIHVTIYGQPEEIQKNLKLLNHAAGFFRSELAKIVKARKMPELRFVYDKSIVHGAQMTELINKAVSSDEEPSSEN